jgi:hypothetical protein
MAIKISELANLSAWTDAIYVPVVETAGNTFSTVKSTSSALKTYVLGTIPSELITLTANTVQQATQLYATEVAIVTANIGQIGYTTNAVNTANIGQIGYTDNAVTTANIGQIGYTDFANTVQDGVITSRVNTANIGQIGYTTNAVSTANIGQIGYTDNAVTTANIGQIGYTDFANTVQDGVITSRVNTANIGQIGYTTNAVNTANIGQIGYTDFANTVQDGVITSRVNTANIGQIGFTLNAVNTANIGMIGYVADAVTAAGGYSNVKVDQYLPTYTGTIKAGIVTVTGNLIAGLTSFAAINSTPIGNATASTATFSTLTVPAITKNGTNGVGDIGQTGNRFATIYGLATSAQYADLAEKYVADADYESGTVLEFGGEHEVTLASDDTNRVAGVVSTQPAFRMNDELVADHAVMIALQGRVPCKVQGSISKGDMLVSAGNGRARSTNDPKFGTVIGKALEEHEGNDGIIEVVVGRL